MKFVDPGATWEWCRDWRKEVVPIHEASFQAALRAGVRMAAGTDYKHPGLWLELKLMPDYGCPPAQVLLQATGDAAEFLGLRGLVGTLEPGAYAVVAAFGENPLEDFTHLQDMRLVLKGGEPIVCAEARPGSHGLRA